MRSLKRSLAVVAVLLVAGCSVGSATDESQMAPGARDSAGGSTELDVAAAETDREIITSGSVTVTVDDPRAAAQAISVLVEDAGGRVEERVEHSAGAYDQASASLVVRIPAAQVTPTLDALAELGTVEEVSLTRSDVTAEVRDLEARIRARQISVTRLEDMLSRAQTTADLVAAENALTERQSDLEALLSQQAGLADQVEMSTLEVGLWTEETLPPEPPSGFWGGLVKGWDSLVSTLAGLLMVIGVLLPWLAFAAVVTLAVLAARRVSKRRQAAKGLPAAPFPGSYPPPGYPPTGPPGAPMYATAGVPAPAGYPQGVVPQAAPAAPQAAPTAPVPPAETGQPPQTAAPATPTAVRKPRTRPKA